MMHSLRPRTITATTTTAVAVALMVALGACGGSKSDAASSANNGSTGSGGGAAASKPAGGSDTEAQWIKCMRDHGVNPEQPGPAEQNGTGAGQGGTAKQFQQAENACKQYAPEIEINEKNMQEEMDSWLVIARCMRSHGISMQDPKWAVVDGKKTVAFSVPQSSGPNDTKFATAKKECKLPDSDIRPVSP